MGLLEQARAFRQAYDNVNATLSDEVALQNPLTFKEWIPEGHKYIVGDRFRYGEDLYKVLQEHVSQSDWTPSTAVSLYVKIADPSIEYPDWIQPTGSHDAYNTGDKVSHNNVKWISLVDANVWEPTEANATLWSKVEE